MKNGKNKQSDNVNCFKLRAKRQGFSLMEMIIAIAIFNIIILATVAIFSSGVLARRNARLVQHNLESARTVIELMAKTIRMSSYLCTDNGNLLDTRINMFNNSQSKCLSYRFTAANNLEIAEINSPASDSDCESAVYSNWQTLVSNAGGYFQVIKTDEATSVIGKATISLNIGENYMQTTVSFRDYEKIIQ